MRRRLRRRKQRNEISLVFFLLDGLGPSLDLTDLLVTPPNGSGGASNPASTYRYLPTGGLGGHVTDIPIQCHVLSLTPPLLIFLPTMWDKTRGFFHCTFTWDIDKKCVADDDIGTFFRII